MVHRAHPLGLSTQLLPAWLHAAPTAGVWRPERSWRRMQVSLSAFSWITLGCVPFHKAVPSQCALVCYRSKICRDWAAFLVSTKSSSQSHQICEMAVSKGTQEKHVSTCLLGVKMVACHEAATSTVKATRQKQLRSLKGTFTVVTDVSDDSNV